jgi:diguanylate cyclase (GGDEF)-like protein
VLAPGDDRAAASPTPEEAYDEAVSAGVPGLAAGLGVVFAGLAVLDAIVLEGRARQVLVPAAAAVALLLGASALWLRSRGLPAHLAHPVAAVLVLLPAAHAVGEMALGRDPRHSTGVMLVLVLAGAVLMSPRWLVAVLYLTWTAWAVGALAIGPSGGWPHYVLGLVGATLLAGLVNHSRRSGVRTLAEARAATEAAAVRDQLTGVANRRGLAMVGTQILEHARRQGDAVHCIFVDIDDLKRVNDALGHAAGDEVIVAVAEALRAVTRATDVVARWGGDEFCVVGPGPGMPPLEMERRVRDTVAEHEPLPADLAPVRVSAGGAMLAPWDAGTLETLLNKADQEMYLRRSLRKETSTPARRAASAE